MEQIRIYLENINGQAMFINPSDILGINKRIQIKYKQVSSIKTIDGMVKMQDEKGENKNEFRIFNACTTSSPAVCKTSGI
jgi:hypothetical protein